MPGEWIHKEKHVNDLSLVKEVDYKDINPDRWQELLDKVKTDFPGFEAKSIRVSERCY